MRKLCVKFHLAPLFVRDVIITVRHVHLRSPGEIWGSFKRALLCKRSEKKGAVFRITQQVTRCAEEFPKILFFNNLEKLNNSYI